MEEPQSEPVESDRAKKYSRAAKCMGLNNSAFSVLDERTLAKIEDKLNAEFPLHSDEEDVETEQKPADETTTNQPALSTTTHTSEGKRPPRSRASAEPRAYEWIELISGDVIRANVELERARKELKDVTAERDALLQGPRSKIDLRLKAAIAVGAFVGWLIALVYVVSILLAVVAYLTAPVATEKPSYPFDPIFGIERSGECSAGSATCYELPALFAGASLADDTKPLGKVSELLRALAASKGLEPVYVVTESGRINLVDLRNSMQRKVGERDYDFMCSKFLGFALDYCIMTLTHENRSVWFDVVGKIQLTAVDYSKTLKTRLRIVKAMCKRADNNAAVVSTAKPTLYQQDAQDEAVSEDRLFVSISARYYYSVCALITVADGSMIELCKSGRDALVMQQLFEWQQGLPMCRSADHTTVITERMRDSLQ